MCGIVGYIGKKEVNLFSLLKTGLINLEYRGYDSAGIACVSGEGFIVTKCIGGPGNLVIESEQLSSLGIGHTRWATHGGISEANAHPHFDCSRTIAVIHNGTIENFAELKCQLEHEGHVFTSSTDTEVLAHLIEHEYTSGSLKNAVDRAVARIFGAYGIVVISKKEPNIIIAARRGSPLLIGLGKDSMMVASDQNALVEYCQQVVYLDDNELVEVRADGFLVSSVNGDAIAKQSHTLERGERDAGKGEYNHFMMKEIDEQALTLKAGLAGRLDLENGVPILGGVKDILPLLQKVTNIVLTGCGTAYHAALYGKYIFEQLVGVPVRAEIASELLFEKVNEPPATTLVIFVSQSGETADTRDVLTELKRRGYLCLGIVNVAGSTIAREAGVGIYIRAGAERAVASTKAFTSQILALMLLAVVMARQRNMSKIEGRQILEELAVIPERVAQCLAEMKPRIHSIAADFIDARSLYFLGKKYSFPVALEGSLKVKEITYIHTESYPAGELKHGPLALVDTEYTAFVIAAEKNLFDKLANTVHEIKARGGKVVLVTSEEMKHNALRGVADSTLFVPTMRFNFLYPFMTVIPLQLLSYELALLMKREIDKPRNLAKSVTVQ